MHVLDLEAKLAADASGASRDELCRSLADDRAEARRVIDGGLPPEDFRIVQEYFDACAAAERVVTGYWRQTHWNNRLSGALNP